MALKQALFLQLFFLLSACGSAEQEYIWKEKEVTVSAYNSTPAQTDRRPDIGAWGDTLKPGAKVVAVSRDLIELGLDYDTQVKIKGLDGIYRVRDKTHGRWRNTIDVYMGLDVARAKEWGRKRVKIKYRIKKDTIPNTN
ncbi:3D domain-containing protein [Pseudozobellia thermophila]|uniref:3D (Asp-Asp-Asp) domain-containing protein n=1 Tax=Pseudozobellia thermophila TaxID=192903 RepID=A0A1M6EQU1_9FLAO|nr:3D domain-containing protein [Pseudozobellia thermophila]SHI87851.1 3D (Asp-Asp-Asp) domain-containing protein [Pseudozobellia thermophila]